MTPGASRPERDHPTSGTSSDGRDSVSRPADLGSRTPTPPYTPRRGDAPTPVQRLAEGRAAARTTRRSAHPDGVPAPLPGAGSAARAGAAKVMQRFSGSGVATRTRVEQQERRARATTLALAGIAVLLIACSALLLFNPFVQHPGFGFDPGNRFVKANSNVPLIIEGTQPPTPTATPPASQGSPTPTPTAQTSPTPAPPPGASPTPAATGTVTPAANGTATPAPTPTPTPRPTVTPTPTLTPTPAPTPSPTPSPTPGPVTVTFTSFSKSVSNGTWSACPSGQGCDLPIATSTKTTESPAAGAGPNAVTGGTTSGTNGYWAIDILVNCSDDLGNPCNRSINPACNNSPISVSVPNGSSYYYQCTQNGYVGAGSVSGQKQGWYSVRNGIGWVISWTTPYNGYMDYSNTYVQQQDCDGVVGSASNTASTWETNFKPNVPVVVQRTNNAVSASCSLPVGTRQASVYPGKPTIQLKVSGSATGSVTWEGFDPNAVPGAVGTALDKRLDGGYAWKSSTKQVCSPPSGGWGSPSGGVFTMPCAASELEYVNWTAAQKTQMANGMAGVSVSNAQAQCASLQKSIQGVSTATSCTFTGLGSATTFPPASLITVVANSP